MSIKRGSFHVLNIRKNGENVFLCSPDFKTKIAVESNDSLPFRSAGNNLGVYFEYDNLSESWIMKFRNPNLVEG